MKTIGILLLTLFFQFPGARLNSDSYRQEASASPTVYICTGPKATAYHSNPNCKGLNKCTHSVKAVSQQQAEQMRRHPCKICYR